MSAWARAKGSRACALAVVAVALASTVIGGQAAAATKPSPPPSGPPYYFAAFDMNDVWKITSGGQVVVGVVSGGVGSPANILQNALIPGGDVSSDGGTGGTADVLSAYDGTQVAALIAAKSNSPVQGMSPGASILPVRDIAKGQQSSDAAETAHGIQYAADHGASVIVVVDTAPKMDHAVATAVAYAEGKDAIVIAPSGNTGQTSNDVNAMCGFDGVVCVGATTKQGAHWPNSASSGKVDLAAPGAEVTVPMPNGSTRLGSSTHYSAALVAAEAALIRSAHPTWTAGQVISTMIQNTDGAKPDHSRVSGAVGYGVIKPLTAVKAPEPSSTANPLVTATPSPPAHPSGAPTAHQSNPPAASSGSSGGSGSSTLLIIGAAVGGLVLIGLIVWLVLRGRSSRGGNYLTDPAYGAGYYYDRDSGPTSQLEGYQDWNSPPPARSEPAPPPPFSAPPIPTQQTPPFSPPRMPAESAPPPPTSPPFRPSQPTQPPTTQQPPMPQERKPQQPPPQQSDLELSGGYTQPFAGEQLPPPPPPSPPTADEAPPSAAPPQQQQPDDPDNTRRDS